MSAITLEKLEKIVDEKFHGYMTFDCSLPLLAAAKEHRAAAEPTKLGCFEVRPWMDDGLISKHSQRKHLLPVLAAYSDALEWSKIRQRRVVERILVGLASKVFAELPTFSPQLRSMCGAVQTADQLKAIVDQIYDRYLLQARRRHKPERWMLRSFNGSGHTLSMLDEEEVEYLFNRPHGEPAAVLSHLGTASMWLRNINEVDAVTARISKVWMDAVSK